MSREASYHWSFTLNFFSFLRQIHIYPSSSVFLPEKIFQAKLRNFESNQCSQIEKKKTAKISEERKFGRSALLFLRHEE